MKVRKERRYQDIYLYNRRGSIRKEQTTSSSKASTLPNPACRATPASPLERVRASLLPEISAADCHYCFSFSLRFSALSVMLQTDWETAASVGFRSSPAAADGNVLVVDGAPISADSAVSEGCTRSRCFGNEFGIEQFLSSDVNLVVRAGGAGWYRYWAGICVQVPVRGVYDTRVEGGAGGRGNKR